jgi:hypothetical protein
MEVDSMARFLVTYHGGEPMPTTEDGRQRVLTQFQAWAAAAGEALVDPGAPLGPTTTVPANDPAGSDNTPLASGYSIVEAIDLDAAANLVRDHPFLTRGGRLRISQAVSP